MHRRIITRGNQVDLDHLAQKDMVLQRHDSVEFPFLKSHSRHEQGSENNGWETLRLQPIIGLTCEMTVISCRGISLGRTRFHTGRWDDLH